MNIVQDMISQYLRDDGALSEVYRFHKLHPFHVRRLGLASSHGQSIFDDPCYSYPSRESTLTWIRKSHISPQLNIILRRIGQVNIKIPSKHGQGQVHFCVGKTVAYCELFSFVKRASETTYFIPRHCLLPLVKESICFFKFTWSLDALIHLSGSNSSGLGKIVGSWWTKYTL